MKKYYMASVDLTDESKFLCDTEKEAIEKATQYLTLNPNCEARYIVRVIKKVSRKPAPVKVENVR